MTVVSAHHRTHPEFEDALAAAIAESGLTPRTLVIRLGPRLYERITGRGQDRGFTALRGIGWVALWQDEAMDDWEAEVVESGRCKECRVTVPSSVMTGAHADGRGPGVCPPCKAAIVAEGDE